MEKVLPCALVMMPRTDWRPEKTSSILGKPSCIESALMERFMEGKSSVAITIYAMGIFSDGSYRMVYKVILLIREYYAGRSDRLKNIGGLRRNLYQVIRIIIE